MIILSESKNKPKSNKEFIIRLSLWLIILYLLIDGILMFFKSDGGTQWEDGVQKGVLFFSNSPSVTYFERA